MRITGSVDPRLHFRLLYEPCSVKLVFKAFAKSIAPPQPALSAQTGVGRYFSLCFIFSRSQRIIIRYESVGLLDEMNVIVLRKTTPSSMAASRLKVPIAAI